MMDSDILIRLDRVNKGYALGSGRLEVLHDISYGFRRHAWSLLLGASGSGKTTLLNLIGALEAPDAGELFFDNVSYRELAGGKAAARFRNRKIGFVFQNYQLLNEFSIAENVMIPAMLAGLSRRAARRKAEELLSRMRLGDRLRHRPAELSGGEQQRAAIARALVNDPELILADEPTGNLDSATGRLILEEFRKLSCDHTLIMITHNEALAAEADCVVRLADGRLVPDGGRAGDGAQ